MLSRMDERFKIQNADGIVVAEYGDVDHANESARENAAAGDPEIGDFYTVWDSVDQVEGESWKSVGNDKSERV